MTRSSFPILSYAARASSRSARWRPALTIFLIRARSLATIGYTIGRAKTPSSNRRALNRFAVAESPRLPRVVRVLLCPLLHPNQPQRFLKDFVLDQNFFTWQGAGSWECVAPRPAAAT